MSTIRAQVHRIGEHDVVAQQALDGLLGQDFLGGVVTQAWVEDGWINVEATGTVVPAAEVLGFSLVEDVPPERDALAPLPPDWKPLGRVTSVNGRPTDGVAYIAPVGTPPPGTLPER